VPLVTPVPALHEIAGLVLEEMLPEPLPVAVTVSLCSLAPQPHARSAASAQLRTVTMIPLGRWIARRLYVRFAAIAAIMDRIRPYFKRPSVTSPLMGDRAHR
jgi:hypothetical protein